jgi:hypothetical protein
VNRAWIPAGALAGVSVAGLMALGPLTDSLTAPVSFEPSIAVTTGYPLGQTEKPVSLKIDQGPTGSVQTAALSSARGGQANAAATKAAVNGDQGAVGYHITSPAPPVTSTVTSTRSSNSTPTKPPKAAVKPRQNSIGGSSGPNGDNGLAGGSSGSTSVGGQSGTPGNDGP